MSGPRIRCRLPVRPRRPGRDRRPGAPAGGAPRAHVLPPRATRVRAGDPRAARALADRAAPPEGRGGSVTPRDVRGGGAPRRIRVGVIFGGRSGEHEVSLDSAASVLSAIDPERYEIVPMGIAKDGQWLVGGDPLRALAEAAGVPLALPPATRPDPTGARAQAPGARADRGRPARRRRRAAGRRLPRAPRSLRRGRNDPGSARAGGRALRRARASWPRPSGWTRRR